MNINEGDMGGQEKKLSEQDDSRLQGNEGDLRCQSENVIERMRQSQTGSGYTKESKFKEFICERLYIP